MDIPEFPPVMNKEWASFVPTRRPQFKIHSNRGQAKNAVLYPWHGGAPRGGVIYHLEDDGEWKVVFSYEQDWHCFVCGEMIDNTRHAHMVDYKAPREESRFVHYEYNRGHDHGPCWEKLLKMQGK